VAIDSTDTLPQGLQIAYCAGGLKTTLFGRVVKNTAVVCGCSCLPIKA